MNIYVGNLNFDLTEDELKELFEVYGQVTSVKIISDKYTGRSKGFGFVEMESDSEANEAIENLNGKDVSGRAMKVNQARERENDNRRGQGGGRQKY
jgi:RNA recognition motif-containing protein